MVNKGLIINECKRLNEARRVHEGKIDSASFFRSMRGNMLITGEKAGNLGLVINLIDQCLNKHDMPTIVLTSHRDLLGELHNRRMAGDIDRVMISGPTEKNYHPFYGMSDQQILRLIRMIAEEMGVNTLMDQVTLYTTAIQNVVKTRYLLSLPAMTALLKNDDDFISQFALSRGLSNVVADNIRSNHEAGIILRRICECLEETFEWIYTPGSNTKYSFLSGAIGTVSGMVFYACSPNQRIMNAYLKEDLVCVLKRIRKIRVILDEMIFSEEGDDLLTYLLYAKRQGTIELMIISKNIKASIQDLSSLDFSNIVMFLHGTPAVTDEISGALFGTYKYHFPAPAAVAPPHLLFTFKSATHWQVQSEDRLKVRSQDLYARSAIFGRQSDYLAVKTMGNDNIYLIQTADFLPVGSKVPMIV